MGFCFVLVFFCFFLKLVSFTYVSVSSTQNNSEALHDQKSVGGGGVQQKTVQVLITLSFSFFFSLCFFFFSKFSMIQANAHLLERVQRPCNYMYWLLHRQVKGDPKL